jgi:branched-chain amino acid transport system ATP-binding protein
VTVTTEQDGRVPASGDELMLTLRGITVRFGGITAVDAVSIDASRGEVLGIIGPNGAGKTTLFDVISGVRAPNEGSVLERCGLSP